MEDDQKVRVSRISNLPYSDRRFVLVVKDHEAQILRALSSRKREDLPWDERLHETIKDFRKWLRKEPLYDFLCKKVDDLAGYLGIIDGFKNQALVIGRSEAQELSFLPGHPVDNLVYVDHPAVSKIYYPLAEFHRRVFEHKFSEACRVLMYLGASKIVVEHVTGWSKEFATKFSTPFSESNGSINAKFSGKDKSTSSILFTANLPGTLTPKIPDGLCWYYYEPTWQEIAESRIGFGLADFSLLIQYTDDYGVNVNVKATVQNAGYEIGGQYVDFCYTQWLIKGIFKVN